MRQNLFVIAQAYSSATGLALTTVSKKIHGNQDFFSEFLNGEISCGVDTYFRMLALFRARWPKGARLAWPKTQPIPRPSLVPYRAPAGKRPRPGPRTPRGKFLGDKSRRGAVR